MHESCGPVCMVYDRNAAMFSAICKFSTIQVAKAAPNDRASRILVLKARCCGDFRYADRNVCTHIYIYLQNVTNTLPGMEIISQ